MMKSYGSKFKSYIGDLRKRIPAPGGGSVACLSFCLGISLIEKAIQYSLKNNTKLKRHLSKLRVLRSGIYPYIDLDGKVFEHFMKAKGKRKKQLLIKSQAIVIATANASCEAISLAKRIESGIKKSIISDFYIGLDLVKVALRGCILNLEENSKVLGKRSRYLKKFNSYLKKK